MQGALIAKLFSTLRRYDVYVLIHSDTFLPGNLDVPLLRLLGKQVVRIWCGSDVRYWHAYEQEMRKLGMEKDVASFLESIRGKRFDRYLQKRDMVRIGERFANLIYAQASYAQLFKRPYLRINLPMAVNEYVYNFPDRDVPLVVHAPSSKERKGTRAILRAVDELHAEGLSFEFRIVQNCSNEQVRIALQEADIVVDQLISAIIGKLALEGMSCGCAVLGRYAPEYAPVPPGCPMIRVTEETIKERLREVIVNRDLRRRLAVEGRQYVETYYDRRVFAKNMLAALESGPPPMHTTTPTFYREYRPKPSLILQETGDFFHDIFKSVSRMGVKPDSR
ncbi:MAG TPA: hypothetical protein VHO48_12295 [Anaerolineaceae bacterium]|nr:hypothetical protein [Anaerolineaceae bacterium]